MPSIFWHVPIEDIPDGCEIQKTEHLTDECHHDIFGWSRKATRKYFIKVKIEDFMICAEAGIRNLTKEDLER